MVCMGWWDRGVQKGIKRYRREGGREGTWVVNNNVLRKEYNILFSQNIVLRSYKRKIIYILFS